MLVLKKWSVLSAAGLSAISGAYAAAGVQIYAGPGYTTTSGGYRGSTSTIAANPGLSEASTAANGLMIGSETYYPNANNTGTSGPFAFIINPLAAGGLTFLSQVPGSTSAYSAVALNPNASLIAGTAQVSSTSTGANVWTPDGTAYVLPLPVFAAGIPASAVPNSTTRGINNSGTVVGAGNYYNANGIQSTISGYAYYNAGTTLSPSYSGGSAVQLLPLGLLNANTTNNQNVLVNGISTDGIAAGSSSFSTAGGSATVWNVGNTSTGATTISGIQLTVPVPAGFNLTKQGASNPGTGMTSSVDILSASGIAAGSVTLFPDGSSTGVINAVRWTPAAGSSLTSAPAGQLLSIPSSGGYTTGSAVAINNNGDVVGTAVSSTVTSAELWKAGTTTPTQLKAVTTPLVNPGSGATLIPATPSYFAKGVNDLDFSVGFATSGPNSTTPLDAILWNSNGDATELNSLTPLVAVGGTSAGWVSLVGAYSITNDGWISGLGVYYDPNATAYTTTGNPAPQNTYGAGTYYRAFEILDTAVPEPTSTATLLLVSAVTTLRRRRTVK